MKYCPKLNSTRKTLPSGISLIELLVATALFVIISAFFATLIMTNFKLFSNQKLKTHVQTQNQLAIDEITNQIREANSIAPSCWQTLCRVSGPGTPVQASNERLILEISPLDQNGKSVADYQEDYIAPDYMIYELISDGDGLYKLVKESAHPDLGVIGNTLESTRSESIKTIATNIESIYFEYKNKSGTTITPPTGLENTTQINITITTQEKSTNPKYPITETSKATLRN